MRYLIVCMLAAAALLGAVPCLAATSYVSIGDNFYSPRVDTILIHDAVQWTDNGFDQHSVTCGSSVDSWDSGLLSRTQTFTHTFDHLGSFSYHCTGHGETGVIVVISPSPAEPGSWGRLKKLYRGSAAAYVRSAWLPTARRR